MERTENRELVRQLVTASWESTACDGMDRDAWMPTMHESLIYLVVLGHPSDNPVGLFSLVPRTLVSYAIHVNMLPPAYGDLATAAMLEAFKWVWKNTEAERIVGEVPEYNSLALNFANRCGMRACGFQANSWKKNGKLYAMILFGISRKAA